MLLISPVMSFFCFSKSLEICVVIETRNVNPLELWWSTPKIMLSTIKMKKARINMPTHQDQHAKTSGPACQHTRINMPTYKDQHAKTPGTTCQHTRTNMPTYQNQHANSQSQNDCFVAIQDSCQKVIIFSTSDHGSHFIINLQGT